MECIYDHFKYLQSADTWGRLCGSALLCRPQLTLSLSKSKRNVEQMCSLLGLQTKTTGATGKWTNSSSAGNLCFLCGDLLISSAGLSVKAKLLRDQMGWMTLNWDLSDCIQAKTPELVCLLLYHSSSLYIFVSLLSFSLSLLILTLNIILIFESVMVCLIQHMTCLPCRFSLQDSFTAVNVEIWTEITGWGIGVALLSNH